MPEAKTNVMRILDRAGVNYLKYAYDAGGVFTDGIDMAKKIGQPVEQVFKTLVTQGADRNYIVFVLPVAQELDLKAAARAAGEKSVRMLKVSEINGVTGYIRGGCSPIGMKKNYRTVLDHSAMEHDTIIISAGRVGCQVELTPGDLIKVTGCIVEPVTTARPGGNS